MLTYYSKSTVKCRVKKTESYFWLLEITRRFMHLPQGTVTSISYFKFLKNFDYHCYPVTIYTSQQQFFLH